MFDFLFDSTKWADWNFNPQTYMTIWLPNIICLQFFSEKQKLQILTSSRSNSFSFRIIIPSFPSPDITFSSPSKFQFYFENKRYFVIALLFCDFLICVPKRFLTFFPNIFRFLYPFSHMYSMLMVENHSIILPILFRCSRKQAAPIKDWPPWNGNIGLYIGPIPA